MIKAVIFDLDDTLLNHSAAMEEAAADFFHHAVKPAQVTLDQFQKIWSEELDRYHQKYLDREITFARKRILRIQGAFQRIGRKINEAEATDLFGYYLKAYQKRWRLIPDAARCLSSLDGCRLGIVTNGDGDHQRKKLRDIGILDRFDSIVISGDYGVAKPDPRIFNQSLEQLGVSAGEALFTGDDYERDFLGAANAGLHACWLNRSQDHAFTPIENGFVINTLELLEKIIGIANNRR